MKARPWILAASSLFGILATAVTGWLCIFGAGWAGSPFQGDHYFNLTLFLVLVLGPLVILPCTILDCVKPAYGGLLLCGFALADVIAIVLNSQCEWGFAIHYAGLFALCVPFPAFVIGTLLFFSSGRCDAVRKTIWRVELVLALAPAIYFSWYVGLDGLTSVFAWLRGEMT